MPDEVMNAGEGQPTLSRDQLMELVADGQRALGQGRADEALMIADSVIESDDQLPAAWALKGDALERQNRLQEALACYERVIDLKPDSTLDRIRANHLRKLATVDELEVSTAPPNRRQAALAAVAATVFFVFVGSAVVLASQPQSNAAITAEQQQAIEANNQVSYLDQQVPPVPNVGGGTSLPPSNEAVDGTPSGYIFRPQVEKSNIPLLNPGDGQGTGEIAPYPVNPTERITQTTPPPVNTTGGGAGETNPEPPFNDSTLDPQTPPKRDGVVKITPSTTGGGGGTDQGTAPPTNDADAQMSANALVQVARDHYVRGDYAKAAAAYEKALRAGAQPSSTNHRLGLCYKNLGRKAEAIAAYERAINAYQAEIDGGANPEIPRSSIAACQQALKILRGG